MKKKTPFSFSLRACLTVLCLFFATAFYAQNVNVKGTGTLKLTSANTFNPQHAVIRFADSGKIEVPAGMTQKFAEGWIGDRRLSGHYTAANLPGHVSGAGAIQVKGVGFQIIFR